MLRPTDTTLPTACRQLDATTNRYPAAHGVPGQLDATTNRHHAAYGLPPQRDATTNRGRCGLRPVARIRPTALVALCRRGRLTLLGSWRCARRFHRASLLLRARGLHRPQLNARLLNLALWFSARLFNGAWLL